MSVADKIKRRIGKLIGTDQKRMNKILPIIKNYENIEGWLLPEEATHLYYYASKLPTERENVIVEIGSWKGKSTYCLAKGVRKGTVHAIDPFDAAGETGSEEDYQSKQQGQDLAEIFRDNMQKNQVSEKVVQHKGYSQDFINEFQHIDLLFIDGDHSIEGCLFDFENYHQKIPVGGIIAFHDYRPNRKDLGSTWVIENKVLPSGQYKLCGIYKSLWVGRKVAND